MTATCQELEAWLKPDPQLSGASLAPSSGERRVRELDKRTSQIALHLETKGPSVIKLGYVTGVTPTPSRNLLALGLLEASFHLLG